MFSVLRGIEQLLENLAATIEVVDRLEEMQEQLETRVDELESAVRSVCEPIFQKPLSEISFAQLLMRLFRVAQRFDVEIQPQMILLHKTLFNIEGLGRELYPQLDLWKTAHPILRRWMAEQVGGKAAFDQFREDLPQIRDALRALPGVIRHLSEQIASDNLHFDVRADELAEIRKQLAAQREQRYLLGVGGTAFVSGVIVLAFSTVTWPGWLLIAGGMAAAVAGRPGRE